MIETIIAALKLAVPLQVILPMLTSNVATLLRFEHKGQVKVGFDADLVVLDDQFAISDVMALGVWHKRSSKMLIKGMFEKN